jgi:hypothetical protein
LSHLRRALALHFLQRRLPRHGRVRSQLGHGLDIEAIIAKFHSFLMSSTLNNALRLDRGEKARGSLLAQDYAVVSSERRSEVLYGLVQTGVSESS